MAKCFLIQPFDNGPYDRRCREILKPAIIEAGLEPYRVDEDPSATILIEAIAPIAFAQRDLSGAAQIKLAIENLGETRSVLMIAAHPDDERTASSYSPPAIDGTSSTSSPSWKA